MRKLFLICLLIFSSLMFISCATSCSARRQFPQYTINSILPRDSFVKIEVSLTLKKCPESNPKCTKTLSVAHASGAVVKTTYRGSYILTADHVCATEDQIPIFLNPPDVDLISSFEILDIENSKYEGAVYAQSNKIDACILYVKDLTERPALKLKGRKMDPGDKAYNVAAPAGFFNENMVPIFEGRYSGKYEQFDIYTIPAMGGSSGSPIVDENGNLVGMIFAVHRRFPFISFSATTEDLYGFLKVLKKLPKD